MEERGKMVEMWTMSFIPCFLHIWVHTFRAVMDCKKGPTQTCSSRGLQTLPSYSPKQPFKPGRLVNANHGPSCLVWFKMPLKTPKQPTIWSVFLRFKPPSNLGNVILTQVCGITVVEELRGINPSTRFWGAWMCFICIQAGSSPLLASRGSDFVRALHDTGGFSCTFSLLLNKSIVSHIMANTRLMYSVFYSHFLAVGNKLWPCSPGCPFIFWETS